MEIEMQKVTSSNVEEVGYDEEKQELLILFKNGSFYAYLGVPESEFQELVNSESVGKYLAAKIKPTYAYERRN